MKCKLMKTIKSKRKNKYLDLTSSLVYNVLVDYFLSALERSSGGKKYGVRNYKSVLEYKVLYVGSFTLHNIFI